MTTPTTSPRFAKDLTFGVEIECYLPSSVQMSIGGYHHGLSIEWAPEGWNTQADSSLSAPAGYKAVEVVSPVLMGEEGLAQVFYMVEELQTLGAKVDSHCGLHVHVGAGHLNTAQVMEIRAAFINWEKAFYGLSGTLAPWRYTNHYSKSSKATSITDRYQGLNLQNYTSPSPLRERTNARTVEFRVWAGTLNLETIITAVYMAVSLVSKVSNEHTTYTYLDDRNEAAKKFQREFWGSKQHRIVPEETASQLASHLVKETRKADRL